MATDRSSFVAAFPEEFTADNWPRERWPNFSHSEMRCSHTGTCRIDPAFMDRLQGLRDTLGTAMQISSGYRAPSHPIEAGKAHPGTHAEGRAVDIVCSGGAAFRLVIAAGGMGFRGIGVSQSTGTRFVHIDDVDKSRWTRPAIWSY